MIDKSPDLIFFMTDAYDVTRSYACTYRCRNFTKIIMINATFVRIEFASRFRGNVCETNARLIELHSNDECMLNVIAGASV